MHYRFQAKVSKPLSVFNKATNEITHDIPVIVMFYCVKAEQFLIVRENKTLKINI